MHYMEILTERFAVAAYILDLIYRVIKSKPAKTKFCATAWIRIWGCTLWSKLLALLGAKPTRQVLYFLIAANWCMDYVRRLGGMKGSAGLNAIKNN